jgi:hypothetical protein
MQHGRTRVEDGEPEDPTGQPIERAREIPATRPLSLP